MSASFGVDFGQKVDLTASIRNILRNYPEGTAVLKELIQNADDAGARKVCFTLDKRSHATTSLADANLAQFQGPALLVYNDAIFSKTDFQSIQRIGDSLKRAEEESKAKIGRFGIGFNAVYHWTELPSFISQNYLVLLDPQARFLPNVNPSNPGKMVDFIGDKSVLQSLPDQFAPYKVHGLEWNKAFNGTLFRLPLRTPLQSETSMLSKRALSISEAEELLNHFSSEASSMLLFLKSIESVEVKVWHADDMEPQSMFSCSIDSPSTTLRTQRNLVLKGLQSSSSSSSTLTADYTLSMSCIRNATSERYAERWEVCTQLGGGAASVIATDSKNALLKLIPYGGVAVLVDNSSSGRSGDSAIPGLAYCFLPLPIETQLPVMVNGFFELSSNRRDVWQAGSDMTGEGRTRAEWNISLMKDVISPAYVRLLLRLKSALNFTPYFQSIFPSVKTPAPWNLVANSVLDMCRNEKLLAITYPNVSKHVITDKGWVPCQEAVIMPRKSDLDSSVFDDVSELLVRCAQKYIACSDNLRDTLEESSLTQAVAAPIYIRSMLKEGGPASMGDYWGPKKSLCRSLLSYVMTDLIMLTQGQELDQLNRLPILPLHGTDKCGVLRTFNEEQAQTLDSVVSMGFGVGQALHALEKNNFNQDNTLEYIMTSDIDLKKLQTPPIFVIAEQAESKVFVQASCILIDQSYVTPSEFSILTSPVFAKRSNIRPFTSSVIKDILYYILPAEFFTAAGSTISLTSFKSETQQMVNEFLCALWEYILGKDEMVSALADSVPLVPVSSNSNIYPLSKMSALYLPEYNKVVAPQTLLQTLQSVGAATIDCDIIDPAKISSRTFLEYVNLPTRQGLLNVFGSLLRSNRGVFVDNVKRLSPSQKQEIVIYLATEGPLSGLLSADITTIRALPIFQSVWDEDSYIAPEQGDSVCLSDYDGIDNSLFPPYYILHSTSNELALLKHVGVTVKSRAQYFKQTFLPSLDDVFRSCVADTGNAEIVINALLMMLSEVKAYAHEDSTFMSYLRSVRFVPHKGTDGEVLLEKVTELFDPSDSELMILMASTCFPLKEFQRDDIVVVLRLLGLQTTLEWPGLIACAKSIASSSDNENAEAKLNRAKNLLFFMDKNIDKLTGLEERKKKENNALMSLVSYFSSDEDRKLEEAKMEGFRNELVSIPWLPASPEPQNSLLPWMTPVNDKGNEDNTVTVCPVESRPLSDRLLCSGSYYIIDHSVSSNLCEFFGWNTELPFRAIAMQLRHIADNFTKANDDTGSSPSSPTAEQQKVREMITALIPQLYQRLNTACGGFQGNAMDIVGILDGVEWIWVGNNFISSERVAYNPTVNAEPYLHCLPQDLSVYKNLLSAFGVKPQFTATDYVSVLQLMAQQQEDGIEFDTELAVAVVTLLTTDTYWQQGVSSLLSSIYIPDQSGKMLTSSEIVNDDVPWQSGPEYSSVRLGLHFVHPNISSKVAEKLGVKSLRMLLVNKTLEQQFFSAPESSVESFGQAESLTSRLKTILDMYPDGNPIFSELIQNADDAGASKLCIVVDENSYGSESVLGPTMAALQGPSVLVYNDAKFTESDYKSLARIGQGSKLDRLATTGRFGLGFNSVYHITDTPSFVSGDHLVFFDPHTTYVPGANSLQPGLRIKFVGSQLDMTFPDQFAPFKYFDCDFKGSYEGTLFRFPLRTSNLARASEISHRSYSVDDVNSILKNLQDQLAQHLLFLRSVRCIEIYRFSQDMKAAGSSPVLIQKAVSDPYDYDFVNDQKMLNFLERKKNREDSKITSRDAFYKILSQTQDDELPLQTFKMKIEVGIQNEKGTDTTVESSRSTLYQIVSGLRGGEAKKMSCSSETRHLKLIPFAAIACALSKTLSSDDQNIMLPSPLQGQAFCFLPLPIKTGLPVHVNGHFELSSNRRDIWSGDDTTGESKLRSNWNKMVLRDVITPLYTKLIIDQAAVCMNRGQPKHLLELLPCPQPVAPWDIITSSIFDLLKNEKIFYSNQRNGVIITPSSSFLFDIEDKMILGSVIARDELESMLLMEDIPVVGLNSKIFKTIADNCQKDTIAGIISPQMMREYFTPNSAIDRYFQRKGQFLSLSPKDLVKMSKNAVFWLTYCLHDLDSPTLTTVSENVSTPNKDYTALYGLKLMPMEDGSLGVIGDPTDPPLYIATDNERKLLRERGASMLITSDQLLGPFIVGKIGKQEFIDVTNVSRLTPIDVLKLLRAVLPKSWFDPQKVIMAPSPTLAAAITAANGGDVPQASSLALVNGGVVDRAGILTDDWLQALWAYVVESNSLDLFKGTIPLLPVRGWSETTGQHIAQISPLVPVLHMSFFRDMSSDTMEALASLGIRVLDSHVLGQFSYSTMMDQFIIPRTPKGVMQAFSVIESNISSVSSAWEIAKKDAIRKFIYTEVLSKSKSFDEEDILILRKFSVYRKYVGKSPVNTVNVDYTNLMERKTELRGEGKSEIREEEYVLKLPPSVASPYLMNEEFIKTDDDSERNNLLKLELQQMGVGNFVSTVVLPQLSSRRLEEKVDEISTFILTTLPQLQQDLPEITETLSNCAFIKVSNGKLISPKELYDPSISEFRLLLGQEAFPANTVYGDNHLLALRSLGLNTAFNCKAILKAATVIESNVNLYLSEEGGEHSALYHDTLRRGRELLLYLDNNIMTLLKEADNEGFQQFISLSDQLAVATTNALKANTNASDPLDPAVTEAAELKNSLSKQLSQMELGGKWAHELRQIRWVPVLTSPPSTIGGASSLIPWPDRIHSIPMAAPSQCVTSSNLWIGSNSQRICSLECRSSLLNTTLGWSKPISGRVVSLQLIGLVDVLNKLQNSVVAASQFYAIVPKIYNCLSVARETESEESINHWAKLLRMHSVVWTGKQFVQASRVAFHPISETMNTEPFLFVVKEELLPYESLLIFLGVREKFAVDDLLSILQDLKNNYCDEPLSSKNLELCIGLLKLSYRLLEAGEESSTLREGLFLPNRAGIMIEARKLTYDDAPWVSAGLNQRSSAIQFVHSDISTLEAKLFGARSLREQLFSGDEVVCPSASATAQIVNGDTMLNALLDLLAMSELIKARDVSIIFDNRQHPVESLMHPGLSTAQGAAVVVYIDKLILGTEDLIKLLTKSSLIPMLVNTGKEKQERRPSVSGDQKDDPKHRYPTTGKKLISAFAITDCLQVLSGSQYFVFDPLGQHLLKESGTSGDSKSTDTKINPSATSSSSRAQRCDIAADEIKTRFPDQFVCMLDLPIDSSTDGTRVNGTVIRLPYRKTPSSLSARIIDNESCEATISSLPSIFDGSLLFAQYIERLSCYRYESDVLEPTFSYHANAHHGSLASRKERLKLLKDKSWKSFGLTSIFSQFVPVEHKCKLTIQYSSQTTKLVNGETVKVQNNGNSSWSVYSVLGAGLSRDMASRSPYRPLKLPPFVTIAAEISRTTLSVEAPSTAPFTGYCYCGAQPIAVLGIPYHIEAPFIQNLGASRSFHLAGNDMRRSGSFALLEDSSVKPLDEMQIKEWNSGLLMSGMDWMLPKLLVQIRDVFISIQTERNDPPLSPGSGLPMLDKVSIAGIAIKFYRYWPYQSRMPPAVKASYLRTTANSVIAQQTVFVVGESFKNINESQLVTTQMSPLLSKYLTNFFSLSSVPAAAIGEMILTLGQQNDSCYSKLNRLTASRMRELLKRDQSLHLNNLRENIPLLIQLLSFCLSDYNFDSNAGEFVIRRAYKEMSGVPVLLMSNMSVHAVPVVDTDRMCVAPYPLQALLPQLGSSFLHPYILSEHKLFYNILFQDSNFISFFNCHFLAEHIHKILPSAYKSVQAVLRSNITNVNADNTLSESKLSEEKRISNSMQTPVAVPQITDAMLYALWRYSLLKEKRENLNKLSAWPVIPCVSRGKRVLLSPSLLPFVLVMLPTASQDTIRAKLADEMTRLDTQIDETVSKDNEGLQRDIQAAANNNDDGMTDGNMWSWTKEPPSFTFEQTPPPLPQQNTTSVSTSAADGTTVASVVEATAISADEIDDQALMAKVLSETNDVPLPPDPPAQTLADQTDLPSVNAYPAPPPPPSAHPRRDSMPVNTDSDAQPQAMPQPPTQTQPRTVFPPVSVDSDTGDCKLEHGPSGTVDMTLALAVCKLGLPFFDVALLDGLPEALPAPKMIGRQLLESLYYIEYNCVLLQAPSTNNTSSVEAMLHFDIMGYKERNAILYEILAAHNDSNLTNDEINKLKILKLLTKNDGQAFAMIECTGGAFWCTSESALDGISLPGLQQAQMTSSVIIKYDSTLRELYTLLGIEELTPSSAIKRFTIPSLATLSVQERVDTMKALASKWGNYSEDTELVNALKAIPFIPQWQQESNGYWECNWNAEARIASSLFNWQNIALMSALQGPHLPAYTVPPLMRSPEWAGLLSTLGLQEDLDKEGFIRVISDIEKAGIEMDNNAESSAVEYTTVAMRGRRVLRYIREGDRISSLFDHDLAKRSSKIAFVPVNYPVNVESGGYVEYESRVVSFEKTMSSSNGSLAFTVLPVVEDDIVPDQIYASALGILHTPPIEIVLRHLRNLTIHGDTLDRWNNSNYSIQDTFSSIYVFLKDHWRDLQPSIKSGLEKMNIIPVNQLLVKPSRVFFRLGSSEDLSPFMFELPRVFGSHEVFLKEIGVKETPNNNDYCLFLTDLQVECRNGRLNPNELKAVLAITHAIADQQQQQTEPLRTASLCLPDESGILRKINNCLLCDDLWLKSRCAHRIEEHQLYILHPFLPHEDAMQLGVRKLSRVVSESLGGQQLMNKISLEVASSSITSSKFLSSLSALLMNRQHDQYSSTTAANGSHVINHMNDQFSEQYLHSKLSALTVSQVDTITVLFQLSVNSSETVTIGEEERLSYVNNDNEILVSKALLSASISIILAVSSALCKFLGIESYLAGTIACLIAQSDEQNSGNSNNNMDGIKLLQLGNDSVLMHEKLRGVPGNPVQERDLPYIENKPFRIFRIGEVVAYLADDGQGPMTYAKVLLVGNAIDAGLRKIKVSTTSDNSANIDLLSTDVFSFKSAREISSRSSVVLDSESSTSFNENSSNRKESQHESIAAVTTEPMLTSSDVSRADLMNTLNGLLHRLNIPTDMQDGSLMDRIITMNETNAKLEEQLRQEVQLGVEARDQMNKMTAAMKCQICISEDVTHVMAPCGHTICLTCLQRLQRNKCPFCRTNINLKVKFFTSDNDTA